MHNSLSLDSIAELSLVENRSTGFLRLPVNDSHSPDTNTVYPVDRQATAIVIFNRPFVHILMIMVLRYIRYIFMDTL